MKKRKEKMLDATMAGQILRLKYPNNVLLEFLSQSLRLSCIYLTEKGSNQPYIWFEKFISPRMIFVLVKHTKKKEEITESNRL